MIQSILRYGAPVLAGALGLLYVQGLRSDNADLRKENSALETSLDAMQRQALADAAAIGALSAGKQAIDETATQQTAQITARNRAQDRALATLERQIHDLSRNPTLDGSVGPDITASLRDQLAAIATDFTARAGRTRPSPPDTVPPTDTLDGGPDPAPGPASGRNGSDGIDSGAARAAAKSDDGVGRGRVESNDGLAGAVAKPAGLSDGCSGRNTAEIKDCLDALFAWVIESYIINR